ncbi:hypothetical protein A9174_24950 [Mesorhizobium loti NZP2037]|nr:hypothetical protein [Mesorhizobium loti]ANN59643.1 hypothetical protein A9174_24950 [Mesorhizobium loti NZP2037]
MGKVQQQHNIGADQADRWRKNARKRRRSIWRPQYLFALVMVPLAVFLTASPSSLDTVAKFIPAEWLGSLKVSDPSSLLAGGCYIKGNISINTGEHIYHVPGQEHYWETKISPQYGERWFCSEQEAVAAGWRRARR